MRNDEVQTLFDPSDRFVDAGDYVGSRRVLIPRALLTDVQIDTLRRELESNGDQDPRFAAYVDVLVERTMDANPLVRTDFYYRRNEGAWFRGFHDPTTGFTFFVLRSLLGTLVQPFNGNADGKIPIVEDENGLIVSCILLTETELNQSLNMNPETKQERKTK
jgi:hypothetical protein